MELIIYIVVIAALLVGSGFLSGSETALTSLSKDELAKLKQNYPQKAHSFSFWQEYPNKVLAVILIGNNFFNIGLGVVSTSMALYLSKAVNFNRGILLVTVPAAVTVLILLFGEIFPKIIARNNSRKFSIFSIGIIVFTVKMSDIFVRAIVWVSDKFINLLGTKGLGYGVFLSSRELKSVFSSNECKNVLMDGSGCVLESSGIEMNLASDTRRMLKNILIFSDTTVGEIMTPRTEMFAVDVNENPEKLIKAIYSQGYSRVPAYSKNIDSIIGIIYAKDLLSAVRNKNLIFIQDILRPAHFVPASVNVTELLKEFKTGKQHFAVVVDEYGGTAGIVTIEDAVEEIVGEIYDEYDEKVASIQRESENVWVVNAMEHLEKINENLGTELPAEQFENLASYVLSLFGRLPKKGEIKISGKCKFEIFHSDKKRVYKVRIEKMYL